MKKFRRKNNNLTKYGIMALLLMIALGYALLSANLNITGTSRFARTTWNIHFENLVPNTNMTLGTNDSAAAITPNKTNEVTYTINFSEPGQYYEFLVDAKNDGTIDGMVNAVTSTIKIGNGEATPITTNPSNLPAYMSYSATYEDGNAIEQYHLLKSGKKETYKVRVAFRTDIDATDLPGENQSIQLTFGVEYIQADSNAIDRGPKSADFEPGTIVNAKLKQLYLGLDDVGYLDDTTYEGVVNSSSTELLYPSGCNDLMCAHVYQYIEEPENHITDIQVVNSLPNGFTPTADNTLSTSTSDYPIYAWYDNGVVNIYSEAETLYLNSNSSHLLYGLTELTNVDFFEDVDSSKVTNFSYGVSRCIGINDFSGLSSLDVSGVTNLYNFLDMGEIESQSEYNTIDASVLSGWNVSNVVYMGGLFKHCTVNNIASIANWNTGNVVDMKYMFDAGGIDGTLSNLNSLSGWNTSSVTNMEGMFTTIGDIDVSVFASWDTSHVTNISSIFSWSNAYGTIAIKGNPTSYSEALVYAGNSNNNLVVNYSRNTTNIDNIIATKSDGYVVKGVQID